MNNTKEPRPNIMIVWFDKGEISTSKTNIIKQTTSPRALVTETIIYLTKSPKNILSLLGLLSDIYRPNPNVIIIAVKLTIEYINYDKILSVIIGGNPLPFGGGYYWRLLWQSLVFFQFLLRAKKKNTLKKHYTNYL